MSERCPQCGAVNWAVIDDDTDECLSCGAHSRRDDPPEYDPDDAEAQRYAETCADANTEYDRIEAEERTQ